MAKQVDSLDIDPNVTSRLPITAFAGFCALTIIIKLMWDLTAKDLFPGAIEGGFVTRVLPWWTAIKLATFITFITGLAEWIQSGGAFRFKG